MKELNNKTKTIRNRLEEMPKLEKRFALGNLHYHRYQATYQIVSIKELLILHLCIHVEQQNLLAKYVQYNYTGE
jgi:hypothetical protein